MVCVTLKAAFYIFDFEQDSFQKYGISSALYAEVEKMIYDISAYSAVASLDFLAFVILRRHASVQFFYTPALSCLHVPVHFRASRKYQDCEFSELFLQKAQNIEDSFLEFGLQ